MPCMSLAFSLGSDEWRITTGWASLGAAVLVTMGSLVLLHTIRRAGRREMPRPRDVKFVPMMTLPGFVSALLLVAVGAGQFGWLGSFSDGVVDGAFGLWWLSNALVIWHVMRERRKRDGGWSRVSIGVLLAALIAAAAGVWFVRATVVWMVRRLS